MNKSAVRRNNKNTKKIHFSNYINKAEPIEEKPAKQGSAISELAIDNRLKSNLINKGFEYLTEIQDEALEPIQKRLDIVGVANTGTGKTCSFLVPLINRLLNPSEKNFKTLIVAPTRELALQIETEFKTISKGLDLHIQSFVGGTSVNRDMIKLKRSSQFVVGTPGRLIDLSDRGALKIQSFSVLVLDEYDCMLDMGFVRDIDKFIQRMPIREQTILFSATVQKDQKKKIDSILRKPQYIDVNSGTTSNERIDQDVIHVKQGQNKYEQLVSLIKQEEFSKVLLFAETKRGAEKLKKRLVSSGATADAIHGDKSQNYRVKALNKFRNGDVRLLVATDVASRGIDIDDITHVINYEEPKSYETYVHRIGRTGRAGKKGMALTFVTQ